VLKILNRPDVSPNLKAKVLNSQNVIIQSIDQIENLDVKQIVFSSNHILQNWNNVFLYYDAVEDEEFDDVLIDFFNNPLNYEVLCETDLQSDNSRDTDFIKMISGKLLKCKRLDLEAYKHLLDSLPYTYSKIDYDQLNDEMLGALLDKKVLSLSADNFKGLKNKGINFSTRLIEIHQTKFVETFTELPLEEKDWINILKSSLITVQNKLAVIEKIDDSIIINSASIANLVGSIWTVDSRVLFRYEVLETIFKSNTSVEKRIALLNVHFPNLDNAQIQALTEKLGEDYTKLFMKQHKPVFSYKAFNIDLFNQLQERGLIIRYEVEDKGHSIRVFAKYQ